MGTKHGARETEQIKQKASGSLGHWFDSMVQARMQRVQHELAVSELALASAPRGRKKSRRKKRKTGAR